MNAPARSPARYLTNAWYVAALSTEVDAQALFHRKILDTSVMIYRLADGSPVALHDRCPHRFAPLHMGKREGDEIACFYHALRFNSTGTCTHNPHGNGNIPDEAKVRAFPLLECHGFIWIWMGKQAADPDLLPDFSPLEDSGPNAVGYTYMHMDANFELIIDNVMDLSHIDHVHGEIISTRGKLSPKIPKIRSTPRSISSRWEWEQQPAMLILAPFLPNPDAEARQYFDITWTPPANIQLSVGAVQGDLSFDYAMMQYDLHTATPETQFTTHYFFATRRNHDVDNAEYNAMKIKAMHDTFEAEDGPIITAVQGEMGDADFFDLNPVLMSNDVGPVRVRKMLQKMIDDEHKDFGENNIRNPV